MLSLKIGIDEEVLLKRKSNNKNELKKVGEACFKKILADIIDLRMRYFCERVPKSFNKNKETRSVIQLK